MWRASARLAALVALTGAGGCRACGAGALSVAADGGAAPERGARFATWKELSRGAPRDGGTLRVHLDVEPPTLNPLVEHDLWTSWIARAAVYDTLLHADAATGEPIPGLATAWRWIDDRTLRLTLRPGVAWHDGRPFTVEDVLFTFARVQDPASGVAADRRADWQELARASSPAPSEIELSFRAPSPLALAALAELPVLPAHAFGPGDLRPQPASRAPVGTGPFRFVSWRAGESIVLERNPRFWGGAAHLDRVELVVVRDPQAAYELARRGALDLVARLAPGQVGRALTDEELGRAGARLVAWRLPSYGFVVWNTRRPGLSDARVRRALALLVDRDRYTAVAYGGRATPVSGPYPLGSPSYDASIAPWPYDPARARQLLDEAGLRDSDGDGLRELDGQPLKLSFLLTAGSRTVEPLATMLAEDLRRAGILLEVVPVDWAVQLDRLRHHAFDASALAWTMRPVQDNWPLFHSAAGEGGQNYGGFSDDETDALLDELRRTPPGPARAALDRKVHRRLHELQPYAFLDCPELDALASSRLRGFAPTVDSLGLERLWLDAP